MISKINGRGIGSMGFAGVVNSIKQLKRPIVVHFVQALGDISISGIDTTLTDSERDFKLITKPVPSFSGDKEVSSEYTSSSHHTAYESLPSKHSPR